MALRTVDTSKILETNIIRDDVVFASCVDQIAKPFVDPLLCGHDTMLGLVREMWKRNLIVFKRYCRAEVGIFCLIKKDATLRLIFDDRPASWLHRTPAFTDMATVGALCQLDLSPQTLASLLAGNVVDVDPRGSAIDLADGFYQFRYDGLASYFCACSGEGIRVWHRFRY